MVRRICILWISASCSCVMGHRQQPQQARVPTISSCAMRSATAAASCCSGSGSVHIGAAAAARLKLARAPCCAAAVADPCRGAVGGRGPAPAAVAYAAAATSGPAARAASTASSDGLSCCSTGVGALRDHAIHLIATNPKMRPDGHFDGISSCDQFQGKSIALNTLPSHCARVPPQQPPSRRLGAIAEQSTWSPTPPQWHHVHQPRRRC